MLYTIIQKNAYQDSITLMLLTKKISSIEGVNKVSIMMGTPANKEILANSGLSTPEQSNASPNDIIIVFDIDQKNESIASEIKNQIDDFLNKQSGANKNSGAQSVKNWRAALDKLPDSNLVLISIPGQYAAIEAENALNAGKNVMIFSDNIPLSEEKKLKDKAASKGLIVMGPDCGTAFIKGVPLAFCNVLPKGNIGIVGASGTGVQEVSTLVAKYGAGVSHILGTGGRDLKEDINATTMKACILALENDPNTECIAVISKPPAQNVKKEVLSLLRSIKKPSVVIFLGDEIAQHESNIYFATTLEECAQIAYSLSLGRAQQKAAYQPELLSSAKLSGAIKGLYAGGTLAGEAAFLITKALNLTDDTSPPEGYMLKYNGFEVIDLGDDIYTRGKPHPMIDPTNRIELIQQMAKAPETAIILLDVVLGYGASTTMAESLIPAIQAAQKEAKANNKPLQFIATICGTELDPQNYQAEKALLESNGVLVASSNSSAVATALAMIDKPLTFAEKSINSTSIPSEASSKLDVSEAVLSMLINGPSIINIGLKNFTQPFEDKNVPFVQYDWQPKAGGDIELQKMLSFLDNYEQ